MFLNIHSDEILGDCLETAFDLRIYVKIMNLVAKEDFHATPEFRKIFNGFYKIRQKSQEWYDKYYELMEEQKKEQRTFEEILIQLNNVKPSVEVSFASKLIATINPDMPIWDQYVLRNLGLEDEWKKCSVASKEERIKKAVDIYERIQTFYSDFQSSDEGKECIRVIDEALPKYADRISYAKKIDYILWSKR